MAAAALVTVESDSALHLFLGPLLVAVVVAPLDRMHDIVGVGGEADQVVEALHLVGVFGGVAPVPDAVPAVLL